MSNLEGEVLDALREFRRCYSSEYAKYKPARLKLWELLDRLDGPDSFPYEPSAGWREKKESDAAAREYDRHWVARNDPLNAALPFPTAKEHKAIVEAFRAEAATLVGPPPE